jgi:hypothetical protein
MSLTPEEILNLYTPERDAAQFSINARIEPQPWELEFQQTHDALATTLHELKAYQELLADIIYGAGGELVVQRTLLPLQGMEILKWDDTATLDLHLVLRKST